jgi:peptidoglycan/LPS O-acetylase OafA/YrhL
MAASLDRVGPAAVRSRLRRLLPALWALAVVIVPLMLWVGWTAGEESRPLRWGELTFWIFPILDPPASDWGEGPASVLWYLRTYLWLVLLSPVLLAAFRRWPVASLLAPLAVLAVAGTSYLTLDGLAGYAVFDVISCATFWMLGFARHDRLLARIPWRVVLPLAVVVGGFGLLWYGLDWGVTSSDTSDIHGSPLGDALYGAAFVLVLMRWEPTFEWLERVPPLAWLVRAMNARAVTVYLWHEPAGMVVWPLVGGLALGGVMGSTVAPLIGVWLGVVVAVLAVGWVEDIAARRRPVIVPGLRRPGLRRKRQLEDRTAAGVGGDRERAPV